MGEQKSGYHMEADVLLITHISKHKLDDCHYTRLVASHCSKLVIINNCLSLQEERVFVCKQGHSFSMQVYAQRVVVE